MWVSGKMTKNLVKAYLPRITAINMKVSGKMTKKMV